MFWDIVCFFKQCWNAIFIVGSNSLLLDWTLFSSGQMLFIFKCLIGTLMELNGMY